jgi:hypothetical protein
MILSAQQNIMKIMIGKEKLCAQETSIEQREIIMS